MTARYLRSSSSVERANSTAYSLGQRLSLAYSDNQTGNATKRRYVYEVTTAGTSGVAPPDYPTVPGNTVADGTLVLTCRECTSWANAAKYMTYIAPACDDILFVANTHDEAISSTISIAFPAPATQFIKVLCVLDTAEPATTLASGAKVSTLLASNLNLTGNIAVNGIEFRAGSGSNPIVLRLGSGANIQYFKNCIFDVVASSVNAAVIVGDGGSTASNSTDVVWEDCFVKNGNVGQIGVTAQHSRFRWSGGGFIGSIALTNRAFGSSGTRAGNILAENLDMSVLGTSCAIASATATGDIVVRNCKLPTGWNGSIHHSNPAQMAATLVWMDNCDDGDTNYRSIRSSYSGTSATETGYVRIGGASNGEVAFSVKLTSSDVTNGVLSPLVSTPIFRWNDSIGSPVTVEVEILHDSVTALTNADVFLDVSYPSVSNNPLGATASNRVSNFLLGAVPVGHAASAETWANTHIMTNPKKQKLSVTFTPQEKGFFIAKVGVCVPNYVVYLDPKMRVT